MPSHSTRKLNVLLKKNTTVQVAWAVTNTLAWFLFFFCCPLFQLPYLYCTFSRDQLRTPLSVTAPAPAACEWLRDCTSSRGPRKQELGSCFQGNGQGGRQVLYLPGTTYVLYLSPISSAVGANKRTDNGGPRQNIDCPAPLLRGCVGRTDGTGAMKICPSTPFCAAWNGSPPTNAHQACPPKPPKQWQGTHQPLLNCPSPLPQATSSLASASRQPKKAPLPSYLAPPPRRRPAFLTSPPPNSFFLLFLPLFLPPFFLSIHLILPIPHRNHVCSRPQVQGRRPLPRRLWPQGDRACRE